MKERGFVLISTLSILLLVSTIALAVAFLGRLELKAAALDLETKQAHLAAGSGLTYLERELLKLPQHYFGESLLEGISLESEELPALPFAFSIELEDEASKLNINRATEEMLAAAGLDDEEIAAILAWREQGPIASLAELPAIFSAELDSERAESLARLLTTTSFDFDLNPEGEARFKLGEFTAQELVQKSSNQVSEEVAEKAAAARDFAELGELTKRELASLIDWVGEGELGGKLNLNTAPEELLLALPGFTEPLVAAILGRREEAPFEALSEVLLLEEFTISVWQECASWITVAGSVFSLRAQGSFRRGNSTIVAVWSRGEFIAWQEE